MNYSLDDFSKIIQKALAEIAFPAEPALLYEPIKYTLSSGGKRIRPLITLASCYMYSDNVYCALDAAVAVEVFHNFTLLHDDIMDKSDIRRGRPTVHKKWDENVAILSGDAMLIYAYKLLSHGDSSKLKKMLEVFNNIAIGVCEGQQYDMNFETATDVTLAEYMKMIELKTSVMMGGSAQLGAIAGSASDSEARALCRFGTNLGLAFQLQDDILDTYGDEKTLGKSIGDDIASNKKTFLLIKALELTSDRTYLEAVLKCDKISREEKFDKVKSIYDAAGVREAAEARLSELFAAASATLEDIKVAHHRKDPLREITQVLIKRQK